MPRRNAYYQGPVSDHFDGARFFVLPGPRRRPLSAHLSFVRGQIARGRPPALRPVAPDVPPARVDALRLGFIGHSSLLVQVAGLNLLIDPVFAQWLGPREGMGPKRAHAPGIRWEDLPPIDAVLVTHNHWDHLDGPALARLWRRFGCRMLTPLGNDTIIRGYDAGIAVQAMDWGQSVRLSHRVTAHLEPAFHWSGRTPFDRWRALWGSWVVTDANGGVLYHVGDTAYRDGRFFRRVREVYGPPDVALIPIGAYEPRWYVGDEHVDPGEAVRIMLDCGARQAFGHHWGAFRLTWEELGDPPRDLARALAEAGVAPGRFRPLHPGETVEPPWPGGR
ncbi:hypothetical protein Rumeso_03561 [Rubellimicrobium mesophilum DSM 19309]|uniref:Metallo-beta-lactamase domain-containing protein n=1 Tax=Rubellimicrobium mesophilum DSM 19309 TaxID=442562 RepID=A0A017HKR5_9RHOB|nr:MBL fold metallo-hydrolase [Rubellimicrobium mesophilum]EYD74920.1 hypothetical protein Rumeso_03561 [Rubellimicrobium mesophilum DSM 19309]